MLCIVEVDALVGDLAAATMSNMRTWNDRYRSRPVMFQQVAGDGAVFRLEFGTEGEALAFVGEFGGRLIRPEPEASAA
jgi:hypothetical protein